MQTLDYLPIKNIFHIIFACLWEASGEDISNKTTSYFQKFDSNRSKFSNEDRLLTTILSKVSCIM